MSDVHSTGALRQQPEAVGYVYRTFEAWAVEHMSFALDKHEPGDDGARLATVCARIAFAAGRATLPEPQSTAFGSSQEARSNDQGEST